MTRKGFTQNLKVVKLKVVISFEIKWVFFPTVLNSMANLKYSLAIARSGPTVQDGCCLVETLIANDVRDIISELKFCSRFNIFSLARRTFVLSFPS